MICGMACTTASTTCGSACVIPWTRPVIICTPAWRICGIAVARADTSAGMIAVIAPITCGTAWRMFVTNVGRAAARDWIRPVSTPANWVIMLGSCWTNWPIFITRASIMSPTGTPAAFRPMKARAASAARRMIRPIGPPIVRIEAPRPLVLTPKAPSTGPRTVIAAPHTFMTVPTVPTAATMPMIALISAGCAANTPEIAAMTCVIVAAIWRNRLISAFRIGPRFAATAPRFASTCDRPSAAAPDEIWLNPSRTPSKKVFRPPATAGDSMISFSFLNSTPNAAPAAGPTVSAVRPMFSSSSLRLGSWARNSVKVPRAPEKMRRSPSWPMAELICVFRYLVASATPWSPSDPDACCAAAARPARVPHRFLTVSRAYPN